MAADLVPRDERDICEAVAAAAATGEAIEITGGGTKRGVGHPDRRARKLSTENLSRIIDYDPAELVLTVEAGVKLADVELMLAAKNQMLAFEPFDFAEIAGLTQQSTMGGLIAAGLAGSRRLSAGGVRDHILGFTAVNGRGEVFKAGGKVVKNVTGYDLSKLMAGSWGRLAVLTQFTLRVLPRPEMSRTLAIRGLDAMQAVHAMGDAMRSQAEVAAASHADGVTAIRLEGFGPSVEARAQLLTRLLASYGRVEPLDNAATHWRGVQTAKLLANDSARFPALWRIVAPPARGAAVMAGVEQLGGVALMDWAGGLVWAQLPNNASTPLRRLAEAEGGHAMLLDASDDLRRDVPALHPEPPALATLSARVRAAFDGVFSPERF